jgi:hypothetical protein
MYINICVCTVFLKNNGYKDENEMTTGLYYAHVIMSFSVSHLQSVQIHPSCHGLYEKKEMRLI